MWNLDLVGTAGVTTSASFHASTGLHFTSNNGVIQTSSSGHMLGIQGGATNMGGRIELRGGNSDGDIRMYAQGATSTQVERLRITSSGKIESELRKVLGIHQLPPKFYKLETVVFLIIIMISFI